MERWNRTSAAALTALVDAALPAEGLSEDELTAVAFDDPDPTLIVGDADGAAVAVLRPAAGRPPVAFLQLVAVRPEARRRGRGQALLAEVQKWAFEERGAGALRVGGGAPFYLWPGVDIHATAALCLFESLGFRPIGAEVNLSYPSRFRAPVADGLVLRRVLDGPDVDRGLAFVAEHWTHWVAETERAVEHGSCHLAVSGGDEDVRGFVCHSVNRLGWLGPMGTDPARRGEGTGAALLGAVARDVMAAGLDQVEVSWIGPVRFYAKAAGATVSRAFRTFELRPG